MFVKINILKRKDILERKTKFYKPKNSYPAYKNDLRNFQFNRIRELRFLACILAYFSVS